MSEKINLFVGQHKSQPPLNGVAHHVYINDRRVYGGKFGDYKKFFECDIKKEELEEALGFKRELERLREALRYYANTAIYTDTEFMVYADGGAGEDQLLIIHDCGAKARDALEV